MAEQGSSLLLWIALAPLIGATLNLFLWPTLAGLMRSEVPRRVYVGTAILSVVAACGIAGYLAFGPLFEMWQAAKAAALAVAEAGPPGTEPENVHVGGLIHNVYRWISVGDLEVLFKLRFDTLTAVMVMIITFVGSLIHIYSAGYMKGDPRERTYFGYLNLFTGAMLILVLGDSLLVMFIGWEGVGLCSYLLIGFWFHDRKNADAGRKAFVVNRIGDFAFILGMCLLFWATKTLSFHDLAHNNAVTATFTQTSFGGERLAAIAGILLFIGACGKSAQIPLYVWLPDAMAGPTPVSALIHAATMVTAGIYMVVRLSTLFAASSTAMAVVAIIGALTALVAAFIAFAQTDLKKVLAYSTVSQLGFMFAAVGVGAYVAGIFHVMTHAFFKAGLFLGAGSVMHALHHAKEPGNIMLMGGLRKKLPITHITFLLFCFAIAGLPGLSGFFSKDEILAATFAATGGGGSGWPLVGGYSILGLSLYAILTVAAFGTALYMFRLYALVFAGKFRGDPHVEEELEESPASMTLPLVVLATLAVGAGYLGLPHIKGLPNIINDWLKTSIVYGDFGHVSQTMIIVLMVVASAVGALGMLTGWMIYRNGPSQGVNRFAKGAGRPLYQASKHKLWVDEFYDATIVKPFRAACGWTFDVIDRFIIDFLIVDGSAFVVDTIGRVVRWFQNGQVQRYLVALLVGSALLLFFTNRGGVDFDYKANPDGSIVFDASAGSGPGTKGAQFEWDFNGDGIVDSTEAKATYQFTTDGEFDVVLRMKDSAFNSWREVEKTVVVDRGLRGLHDDLVEDPNQPAKPAGGN